MRRLEDAATSYLPSARALADVLGRALEAGDVAALERLVSTTHFAVGPAGGHTVFEEPAMLDALFADLIDSRVRVRPKLAGSGGKRYLTTSGWKGELVPRRGHVAADAGAEGLAVDRRRPVGAPRGVGRALAPGDAADEPAASVPAARSLAVRPELQGRRADRVHRPSRSPSAPPGRSAARSLAVALAHNACGFGPRGFYYNQGPTHDEQDAFAIDFTRYERNVPYDNESGGTPVLAAHGWHRRHGRRRHVIGRLELLQHRRDRACRSGVPTDTDRFRSRYMHLAGPFQLRSRC